MNERFWTEDPPVLLNNYYIILPDKKMSRVEQLNTVSRFIIYFIILCIIFNTDTNIIIYLLVGLILIIIFFYIYKSDPIGIKNDTYVDFPIEGLDLSKYVIGYNKHSYIYDLYGICNHIGNSVNGHYFSYIKNYDNWYEMNDDIVTKIIDYEENIVTNNAYCLFYRKRKQ